MHAVGVQGRPVAVPVRNTASLDDGELLGVVLYGDGQRFTDILSRMQSLVTQWGMDPLWDTGLPWSAISPTRSMAPRSRRTCSRSLRRCSRGAGPRSCGMGGRSASPSGGPFPPFGPMKFPGDSEYQDVSFILGLHETGGNRVELVLQKRDPNVNSDLAWRDATTLDSQISTETATLRAAGREPRRLMLREFER